MTDRTFVCRCEDVTITELEHAFAAGLTTIEELKRYTGFGTGPCQGKECMTAVARELISTGRTERPVAGFKGRSGRSFRARLALMQSEDGKWRVEFDEPWAREGAKPPEGEERPQQAEAGAAPARAA